MSATAVSARDPLAMWFASRTCPALEGGSGSTQAPNVKIASDTLIVHIPDSILPNLKQSMTVPWYVYDPKTGTAYSHLGGDSGVVQILRQVDGPPPASIPRADLSGARTQSGIELGASAASVVQKLGKPRIVRACGMERYEYNDTSDPAAEPNDLDFTIRDGRVIEILHTIDG